MILQSADVKRVNLKSSQHHLPMTKTWYVIHQLLDNLESARHTQHLHEVLFYKLATNRTHVTSCKYMYELLVFMCNRFVGAASVVQQKKTDQANFRITGSIAHNLYRCLLWYHDLFTLLDCSIISAVVWGVQVLILLLAIIMLLSINMACLHVLMILDWVKHNILAKVGMLYWVMTDEKKAEYKQRQSIAR
jgi:hypothetical protein